MIGFVLRHESNYLRLSRLGYGDFVTSDEAQWDRMQEFFHLMDGVPEQDLERKLIDAGAEPSLRARVLSILKAGSHAAPPDAWELPNHRIGPYVVIDRLGSGGIGTVYLVERDAGGVLQRLALKVLAPHAAGPSFVDRFRREQCILGSLDHPYITRMLDAGFGDRAEPYLVMEYVAGVHLDEYCDQQKLTIEDRLRLFMKIAEGVAYAHRNLVVHLDLKPSNILVTRGGAPKLLDFGTSKVLSIEGGTTTTLPVTPSYASPEQLRHEAVTTACDIYALGVILHELLAGVRPEGGASMAAMIERAIAESEPAPLAHCVTSGAAERRGLTETRLRAVLAGDLSIIVQKSLAARPHDRYPSVDALSGDIGRYLDGRPILARRQTTLYRVGKFVWRNSGKVTLTLALSIALIATASYAWWRQQQALRDAQRALVMQTFMTRLFRAANSNVTGKPVTTIKELLQLGAQILRSLVPDAGDQRRAQLSLGESLYLNQDLATAKSLYTEALNSAIPAGDIASEAEALSQLGLIGYFSGQNDIALSDTEKGFAVSQGRGIPADVRLLGAQAYVLVHEDLGRTTDKNAEYLEEAIRAARTDHLQNHAISAALIQLGGVLSNRRRFEDAERAFREGIQLVSRDRLAMCDEAGALYGLGGVYRNQNRPEMAVPVLRDSYERMKTCYGDQLFTLQTQGYWADAMISSGRAKDALPELEAAESLWRRPPVNRVAVSQMFVTLGRAYLATGRFKDAERAAAEAFPLIDGQVPGSDRRVGAVQLLWGRALAGQGRYAEAKPHADIAVTILNSNASSPLAKKYAEEARLFREEVAAHAK
jgi:tetratricopeptide (TPR) repeat protein